MDDVISRIIFQSIRDGVFTVNKDCRITSFNPAAEEITGFTRDEAVGKHCFDIFRTEVCHTHCALKDTLKSKEPIKNARVTIITREGCEIPIMVSTTLLRDDQEKVVGAVEFFQDISTLEQLRDRLNRENTLENIISVNQKMRQIIELLPDIAESECNVLIQGPSGSGKELIAQAIHNLSPRKYGSYIRINCGALPATLLESELFGYEKGAFTDAKRNKPGTFCLANGGTLLLDEISEMEPQLQAKLLRVLNNGEYQPLGSTRTQRTDARIIAATNADLQRQIRQGQFREDLYFRLNVVSVDVPPLRERPEDIPILIDHFINKMKTKLRKPIRAVAPEVMALLVRYPFPGNVRELENAIEHAFVMCHGEKLEPDHLPDRIRNQVEKGTSSEPSPESEKSLILGTLKRCKYNRTRAARELGMHRSTLWRKMVTHHLIEE
ncbi:sigma 54-interacting transcriptional regulator [bacterium]|nr:sigma 54-interacting transcriptional regulator [bacterium]